MTSRIDIDQGSINLKIRILTVDNFETLSGPSQQC